MTAARNNLMVMTRELAFAAGQDAASRLAHKAGRFAWNDAEREIAVRTTNKLLLYVPFEKGGLHGLPFSHSMLEDLGLAAADALRAGCEIVGHNGGEALAA